MYRMSEQFRFAFHNSMVQAQAKLLWPKRNRHCLGCLSSALIHPHRLEQIRKVKVQTRRHRLARADGRIHPWLGNCKSRLMDIDGWLSQFALR
jgi:hypothetical protein